MNKCAQTLRYICDNLDAEVNSPKCIEISRHLEDCSDCTAYLDSMKKTISMYRRYPTEKVPRSIHALLTQIIKRERVKSGRKSHSNR